MLGKGSAGEVDDAGTKGGDVLHDAGLFPPVLKLGGRCACAGAVGEGVEEEDEAVGVWKGRGFEQDGIDYGEDGGIRADAERQGEDGGEGEAGALAEGAECVFQILKEGFHASALGLMEE